MQRGLVRALHSSAALHPKRRLDCGRLSCQDGGVLRTPPGCLPAGGESDSYPPVLTSPHTRGPIQLRRRFALCALQEELAAQDMGHLRA